MEAKWTRVRGIKSAKCVFFEGGRGFAILSRIVRAEFPGNVTFEQRLKQVKE